MGNLNLNLNNSFGSNLAQGHNDMNNINDVNLNCQFHANPGSRFRLGIEGQNHVSNPCHSHAQCQIHSSHVTTNMAATMNHLNHNMSTIHNAPNLNLTDSAASAWVALQVPASLVPYIRSIANVGPAAPELVVHFNLVNNNQASQTGSSNINAMNCAHGGELQGPTANNNNYIANGILSSGPGMNITIQSALSRNQGQNNLNPSSLPTVQSSKSLNKSSVNDDLESLKTAASAQTAEAVLNQSHASATNLILNVAPLPPFQTLDEAESFFKKNPVGLNCCNQSNNFKLPPQLGNVGFQGNSLNQYDNLESLKTAASGIVPGPVLNQSRFSAPHLILDSHPLPPFQALDAPESVFQQNSLRLNSFSSNHCQFNSLNVPTPSQFGTIHGDINAGSLEGPGPVAVPQQTTNPGFGPPFDFLNNVKNFDASRNCAVNSFVLDSNSSCDSRNSISHNRFKVPIFHHYVNRGASPHVGCVAEAQSGQQQPLARTSSRRPSLSSEIAGGAGCSFNSQGPPSQQGSSRGHGSVPPPPPPSSSRMSGAIPRADLDPLF